MAAYYASLNETFLREIEQQAEQEFTSQTESSMCDTPSSSSNNIKDESTDYIDFTSRHDPRRLYQQRRYSTPKANSEKLLRNSVRESQGHEDFDQQLKEHLENCQHRSEQLGSRILGTIRRLDVSLENVQRIVSAEMEKKEEIHKLVKEMRDLCRNFVHSNADMMDFFERLQTKTFKCERELKEEIQHPALWTRSKRIFFRGAGVPEKAGIEQVLLHLKYRQN
jgi:hypothetical protein